MINLCLVVIATQFSETKKREMERMRLERSTMNSSSSISSTSFSEPTGCYNEIVKYIAHLTRCGRRRLLLWYKHFRRKRRKEESGRTSISLRRRARRSSSQQWSSSSKHRRSSASLNGGGGGSQRKTSTHVHPMPEMAVLQVPFAESPQAPCASPEISDIDLIGSPRRPNLEVPRDQPSYSGSDYLFSTDSSVPTLPQDVGVKGDPSPGCRSHWRRPRGDESPAAAGLPASRAPSCWPSAAHKGPPWLPAATFLCTSSVREEAKNTCPRLPLIFYYPEPEHATACRTESGAMTEGSEGEDEEGSSDLDDFSFMERYRSSMCCRWWKPKQAKLKQIVDHRYFQRGF
ncbi:voltage-dependent T-type calcium channel subunit alpha [Caerostris extrusa]|uniref:Voltage-dependent T-type calcium channel subunit alpha n=1 Tax=Caerostris extrusa TaxID=172846 RepID=A0AAV4RJU1_CAEEX|nr:voltage-dependent T-type calcium channel subunit alpha [Caerostris extrusa]